MKQTNNVLASLVRGVLLGVFLSGIFAAGFIIRGYIPIKPTFGGDYPRLTEVQTYLNQSYVRAMPSQKDLEYGAIRGMLASLNDKYTFFVPPVVASNESDALAGQYGGIGVQIKRDEAGNFVLYPFPDSPAAKAGVVGGDILINANNTDVTPASDQDTVQRTMRGEVKDNNGVTITVKHSSGQQETFTIAFAVIQEPSVVWRTLAEAPSIGYIQIIEFTSRTPTELTGAINDLKSKQITSLVLDLRNNPGGLLEESIQVASQFLDSGVVLYEDTRSGETVHNVESGNGLMTDLPMVILINQGTASAAEVVAGALHDHKRATLIGQQSYGKGSVQLIIPLADQSSLHVTTAEWLTPNKTSLDSKGLAPDVPMIPDQSGRDIELGEAILFLRDHKT